METNFIKNYYSIVCNYFKNITVDRVSYILFIILLFLIPSFIIPTNLIPIALSKNLIIFFVVLLSFTFYIISILRKGSFNLPNNLVFMSAGAILVFYFLSSIFSPSTSVSMWGYGFEIDTFSFILIMFIVMFLVSEIFISKERIFISYLVFFLSLFVAIFFQILRLIFGADFLFLSQMPSKIYGLVGSPLDFAVFLGIGIVLSLVTIEMFKIDRILRNIIYISLIISLIFLIIIDFAIIWFVLFVFSILLFLYIFSFDSFINEDIGDIEKKQKKRPIYSASLLILVISVILILSGGALSRSIQGGMGASNFEVSPNLGSTLEIAKNTVFEYPIFGAGPNRFFNQWVKYKSVEVNQSIFWNRDFFYGSGLIPTFLTTLGLLGFLLWLVFFATLLYFGFRAITSNIKDMFSHYILVSSFFISLYLWVMNVFHTPGVVIMFLSFFFTGIFISALYSEGIIDSKKISFLKEPKVGLVSVIVLITVLIINVFFVYLITTKSISAYYYNKSLISFQSVSDLDTSELRLIRAINLSPNDVYYRALTDLYVLRLNVLLSSLPESGEVDDSVVNEFQRLVSVAQIAGEEAVSFDDTNYNNWMFLGKVYEVLALAGIDGAYESANDFYEKALELNPKSPSLYLTLAGLEVVNSDLEKAREYVSRALMIKSNYIDAYLLLSQIEVTEGNLERAISSASSASIVSPNNAGIHFQVGLLKYHNEDYEGSVRSLKRALEIVPDYSNAKYFLALSYEGLGMTDEALVLLEELRRFNQENRELDEIIRNIRSGNTPFSGQDDLIEAEIEMFDEDLL